MKRIFWLFVVLSVVRTLVGCAASANSDGSCKRTCGSKPLGGGNIRIYAASNATTKWTCTADGQIGSQTLKFLVVEQTSSANKADFDPKTDIPKTVPVAGIAFSPEGFPITTTGTYDTPANELCTDSCGYATVSFTPSCMDQDVNPTIVVPGWQPSADQGTLPTVSFSVKKEN